jgi:hypothetical protein
MDAAHESEDGIGGSNEGFCNGNQFAHRVPMAEHGTGRQPSGFSEAPIATRGIYREVAETFTTFQQIVVLARERVIVERDGDVYGGSPRRACDGVCAKKW